MTEKMVVAGDKAIDFTFESPFEKGLKLSEEVKKAEKTYLVFLRYFGCRICQLDLREFAESYEKFREKDAQLLVVLQSTPESLHAQTKPEDLPYTIVCDPDQGLYHTYQIRAAESKEAMGSERGRAKVERAASLGMVHGDYEGNELQLPAIFLLDRELNILYAHRAENGGDMPDTEEMLAKL